MKNADAGAYILGLDIGSTSIGWAHVSVQAGRPIGLAHTGARVFEAAMEGNLEAGTEESRATKRREARLLRRQTDRRGRRTSNLFHLLQRSGLLPSGDADQVLPALDAELLAKYEPVASGLPRGRLRHVLPYWLRARALDHALEPYELGRTIYHLGQRRGFLSNRRAPKKEDEKKGKVKAGIDELSQAIQQAEARTLGEYLASLDPHQERIRNRYTHRSMYEAEFESIWSAQAPHRPALLNDQLKHDLSHVLFFQRPLKSSSLLIGDCELEPGRKRAPWALLIAQRFRLLQMVNNTCIRPETGPERPLSTEERAALVEALHKAQSLKFAKARKLLGLSRGSQFNWEEGGEKAFLGNKTNARLAGIFGDRWWQLSALERDAVVEDVRSIVKDATLKKRGLEHWRLDEEAAAKLAELELEDGYCNFSRQALARLLPHLEQGLTTPEAIKKVYPERSKPKEPLDLLPPLHKTKLSVRNPAVMRVLSELRKLVNALVRRYGKPAFIRIELARDLRRNKKQRQESWKRMRANEAARQNAAARLLAETGISDPKPWDIERVLLADECGRQCPYTGKQINWDSLFGAQPEFQVEHILPLSRTLDDSFLNKTLCHVQENKRKHNRTPHEAYAGTDQWDAIISRVKGFQGNAAREKLRRFQLTDLEDLGEVADRQLNDTRYASRLAAEYVSLLYGGLSDASGTRRIQAGRGGVTAFLRQVWGLNSILGDIWTKSRDDHRHHAVDAVVIALTDPAWMRVLSESAARSLHRNFEAVPPPWEEFRNDVKDSVLSINVSHRPSRRLSGALHDETNYAPPQRDDKGKTVTHVRKPLNILSADDVDSIVDPAVREIVRARLAQLGSADPKKAFKDKKNDPALTAKDGRRIPIHKVRIRRAASPQPIGVGPRRRYVLSGANHHMEIVETADRHGRRKWEGHLVTMLEATGRLAAGEPVVRRDHGPGKRFLFSLAPGELIELDDPKLGHAVCRIRSVSHTQTGQLSIEFCTATDARPKKEIKASGRWVGRAPDALRKSKARKVTVDLLGDVLPAND